MTDHVRRVQDQFTRQGKAYEATAQARDERAMAGLVRLSGAGPADRILDVACGPGILTMVFAEHCSESVGCDVTAPFLENARARAKARGVNNVHFVGGRADALPFEDASFDTVVCRAAFHHFVSPAAVLSQMKRVARQGRSIVIADIITSEDPAKATRHNEIERLCDPTHTTALPRSAFLALFDAQDLTLINEVDAEMHYDVEGWMDHGGPDSVTRTEIVRQFEHALASDDTGLNVRQDNGVLTFSHQTAAFVLQR